LGAVIGKSREILIGRALIRTGRLGIDARGSGLELLSKQDYVVRADHPGAPRHPSLAGAEIAGQCNEAAVADRIALR